MYQRYQNIPCIRCALSQNVTGQLYDKFTFLSQSEEQVLIKFYLQKVDVNIWVRLNIKRRYQYWGRTRLWIFVLKFLWKQKFFVWQFSQSWCICCRGRKENKLGKYLQNNKWEEIFKWKYLHPVFAGKFMYLSPFVDNKMISGGGVLRLWQSATCWWGEEEKNIFL